MSFEVNGVQYFLTFNPGEGAWMLLTPGKEGLRRLAIEDDNAPLFVAQVDTNKPGDHQPLN